LYFILHIEIARHFKFEFESKEFENIKGVIKRKKSTLVSVFGPNPGGHHTRPGCLASHTAQLGPPGARPPC
jgi:hypothetical protein